MLTNQSVSFTERSPSQIMVEKIPQNSHSGLSTSEVLCSPKSLIRSKQKLLNSDVLRSDAAPLDAFNRISKSKSSIGKLIMDQSVMAGIGNIYRTEILWRQGVHPEKPGKDIDRKAFDNIWEDAKNLLAIGVRHNAIITVDRAKPSGGRYRERVNIFNQEQCPKCLANIRMIEISGRKAYVCESCQPRDFDS